MKAHLAEAIAKLSEREQLILSLYYREELTMKEIAEVVGMCAFACLPDPPGDHESN